MDEGTQNVHEVGGPTTRQSRRRMRVKAARVVGVLLILAIIGGAIGWLRFIQIVLVEGRAAYVDIRPGDSVTALSERVFALGMTSSPQALRWYWRLKRGGSLRDGRYALQGISNMEALYQLLAAGSPLSVRVTFPEGYTVQQMATRLQEQADIIAADFLKAARDDQGKLLEGRLFPDTYDVLYAGDTAELVARMLGRFADVVPSDWAAQAAKRSLTGDQLLRVCLLYTSDAADDLLCVDLGGRRIIKKKKQHN